MARAHYRIGSIYALERLALSIQFDSRCAPGRGQMISTNRVHPTNHSVCVHLRVAAACHLTALPYKY